VLDAPSIPTTRDPLGRLRALVIGAFVGGLLAVLGVLLAVELRRHRAKSERRRAEERAAASIGGRAPRLAARGVSTGDAAR
jgi:hypothetical protein